MPVTLDDLNTWMLDQEAEHLEFKEAKGSFKFDKLRDYCAALANEDGGKLVLGVSDRRPRRVVATNAFRSLEKTKADLLQGLHIRIDVTELAHPDGRVLVFEVPSRPLGMVVMSGPKLLMRGGEGLVPMSQDMQRRILNEAVQDFTALGCPDATLASLSSEAIESFRKRWARKAGRADILSLPETRLLEDAELIVNGEVTYAALVLLGSEQAIRDLLPQAEVVFEYRSGELAGPAQDRRNFAGGFMTYDDELAKLINLRNDKQHIQDGLFIWDVPTFDERVVREAVLNAVSHRDYRLGGSILIRQYPKRLEVVSPGGFPEGVTPENILWQQNPRNRRVAETLARCGLVERSGQGADVMFEQSIRTGKATPDYTKSDDWQVHLDLNGLVQDIGFLRYIERATREKHYVFSTEDLLVLNDLRTKDRVPERLAGRLDILRAAGLIVVVGRGRGTRYMLSKALYKELGKQARYTRRRGLDRQTNKELLLRHLRDFGSGGVPLRELCRVVPDLGYYQVRTLLKELKAEGRAYHIGLTRAARWYPTQSELQRPPMAHDDPCYNE